MALTTAQLALVHETFHALQVDLEIKSLYFYEQLFRLDPSLRSLFRGDLGDQGMRFMSTLSVIVQDLDQPERLAGRFADLGEGHAALGVKAAHFATMEDALIATIGHFLDDGLTTEAEAAWRAAFREISAAIIASGGIPAD